MNLPRLAIRRPVAITVLVIITLLFGVISLQKIGIDLLPDLNFPVAAVVTLYPGSSALTVEQDITVPIEGMLASVSGLRSQDSFSTEGASVVILQFEWGTNMVDALESVRNSLAQAALVLPEDVQTPVVAQIDPNDFPLMLIGVDAEELTALELSHRLERIRPQLEQLPGVAQVNLLGISKEEIQVLFDPEYLNEIGLTPVMLQQLIAYQNIVVPGGAVTAENSRYTTRAGSQISSVEELKQIIVGMRQSSGVLSFGGLIPSLTYLGDIAEVSTGIEPRDGITRYNGRDAVLVQVNKQSGANVVRVAERVKDTLGKIEAEHPDLEFSVITDQSLFINQSIGNLASSGIVGGFLAVAVLWIFLRSFRSLFVIGLSIPVSVIASFVLVYFSKLSLNLMTLGGLALGVGMLVDSSIVVLENIYRHFTSGMPILKAAEVGAQEVASAITASTTTTIAVFLPVVFVQGIAGQLLKEFGLTISYSLIASLAVALTVIPMLASKLFKKGQDNQRMENATGNVTLSKMHFGYGKVLNWALQKKAVVFAAVIVLIGVAIVVYPRLDQEFLPSFDEGFIGVQAMFPAGLSLETTRERIENIERELNKIPEVERVAVRSGDQGELDMMSLISGAGLENAEFYITLAPHGQRKRKAQQITDEIQEIMRTQGVVRANITDSSLFGSAGTLFTPNLSVQIRGEDETVLTQIAEVIKERLGSEPGFRDIQDSHFRPSQELYLKVDTSRSILGGFTAGQVGLGMRYATAGLKATDITIGNKAVPVVLRPNTPINSLDDLLYSKISSPVQIGELGKDPILLNEVVEPVVGEAQSIMQRHNRLPVIYVTGILGDISLTDAVNRANEVIADMDVPPGYHVEVGGVQEIIRESLDELMLALVLAVALIYLVMAAQFESFTQPFIIMFSIPLALIGSLVGLLAVGGNFGVMAIIGVIVLAGIVVNNAIVLVDYINLRRNSNPDLPLRQVIVGACQVRLRPILMTSITTIFGLIPVALGIGAGSEFQRPLAATLMGGLITSALLTLFVIPAIYEILAKLENRRVNKDAAVS